MSAVHGAVPERERKSVTEVDRLRLEVRRLLGEMVGKENAMTSDAIMRRLGRRPKGTNEPLRASIKQLLNEEGVPLLSNSRGFFVARDMAELEEWEQAEHRRAMAILRNVASAKEIREKGYRTFEGWGERQGKLF